MKTLLDFTAPLLCLLFSILSLPSVAQQKLVFEEDTVFLGRINSYDPIQYSFVFTHKGSATLKVEKLESDCACSVLSFSKKEIQPGVTDTLKVIFEPYKPGPFVKYFRLITSSPGIDTFTVQLKGYIEPYTLAPEYIYKDEIGPLKMETNILSLGKISDTTVFKKEIILFNPGEENVVLLDTFAAPAHLFVFIDSVLTIPPGHKARLFLYFHPELKNEWGYINDNITLYAEVDSVRELLHLPITAFVTHHIKESEKASNRGILHVSTQQVSFGKLKTSQKGDAKVLLSNKGSGPLTILGVSSTQNCSTNVPKNLVLAPGESFEAVFTVEFAKKYGYSTHKIHFFSNDTQRPAVEITGTVHYSKE